MPRYLDTMPALNMHKECDYHRFNFYVKSHVYFIQHCFVLESQFSTSIACGTQVEVQVKQLERHEESTKRWSFLDFASCARFPFAMKGLREIFAKVL